MELWIIFPMLSMLSSVAPASLAEARAPSVSTRHSRSKRCSCATFLDKECVYFCHLDIIWVNTPERTVSYGLGNAPRKKRSVPELARCECADTSDGTCVSFCHARNLLRHKAARDKVIPTAGGHDCAEKKCKHDLTVKTPGITRDLKRAEPSVPRATVQLLQLLLEKQRIRLSQRISQNTPAWPAEKMPPPRGRRTAWTLQSRT